MKLNFEDSLGATVTYTSVSADCPDFVKALLEIDGITSVYVCGNFMTVNRDPRKDWQPLLSAATAQFGVEKQESETKIMRVAGEQAGQVQVFVQVFKGVPIQVKVVGGTVESRVALDARFSQAAVSIQDKLGSDFLKERFWDDWGFRYGEPEKVAKEVSDEIEGTISEEALTNIVSGALDGEGATKAKLDANEIAPLLEAKDWHVRLGAVQDLSRMEDCLKLLIKASSDPHPQVRRLVAAALGATEDRAAVPTLCEMLTSDKSIGVRRTAGDALSDIGDVAAQESACRALSDENKLVRWRAARFLFEIGTDSALPFLEAARDDKEYEVRLEIDAAIQRISSGIAESMPVWKQISQKKD